MQRCKVCNVPLSGFLGKIVKLLFRVRPSSNHSQICNKCAGRETVKEAIKPVSRGADQHLNKKEGPTYKCQICSRMILTERALEHIKAEEYIINLIKKDHPIFKRIALHTINRHYRDLNELFWKWENNPLDEVWLEHEIYELLKKNCTSFTKRQLNQVLDHLFFQQL